MSHYITTQGLEKLAKELENLKTVARHEVIARIASARELGDLKENSEYTQAKEDQAMLESRIIELESMIKNSQVIGLGKHGDMASVGSTVEIEGNGQNIAYTIVGAAEADPMNFCISNESPLGRAFLGRKVGESVTIKAPKGEFTYKITAIK